MECSNYHTLYSLHIIAMLCSKIFQSSLQQYMSQEVADIQAGFQTGRRIRDQISNIPWIWQKARVFQKNIYFFLTTLKPLTVWITKNCGKILKGWKYQKPYLSLEKLVWGSRSILRTRNGKTDWFQTGKELRQDHIWSRCLFTFYAEYITGKAGLDESQARIKIVRRSIKKLRYGDNTKMKRN